MERVERILQESLNIDFIGATISNPKEKGEIIKIKVRPVLVKNALLFQCESYTSTQVFHDNLETEQAKGVILGWLGEFRQMQLETKQYSYSVLISKKGKITIQKKQQKESIKEVTLEHNRSKHYILEEGTNIPFLEDLGVMSKEGKIIKINILNYVFEIFI